MGSDSKSTQLLITALALGIGMSACKEKPEPPEASAERPPAAPSEVADASGGPQLLARAREFHGRGNFIEALPLYGSVLTLNPGDAGVLESLALCQKELGEIEAAAASFRRALAANPELYVACNELAWLLATDPALSAQGTAREAVTRAQQGVELTRGQSPELLGTLAAAHANAGDFASAKQAGDQAFALAQSQGKIGVAGEVLEQLEAYSASQPWRVPRSGKTALQLAAERQELDATVFAAEREAQKHETVFVDLWDKLLARGDEAGFEVLAEFEFENLLVAMPDEGTALGEGVGGIIKHAPAGFPASTPRTEFAKRLERLRDEGWKIAETEWHHSVFTPATPNSPARSRVSAVIHGLNAGSETRVIVKATLDVKWHPGENGLPQAGNITVADYQILQRSGKVMFEPLLSVDPRQAAAPGMPPMVLPLIVRDLDRDGLPEIVLGGCNLVYWNRGANGFEKRQFLSHPRRLSPCGLIADFDGDGSDDFVAVGGGQQLHLWRGAGAGQFESEPVPCFSEKLPAAQALTAGDIDGDGDLDLFLGQYLSPYRGGQMPTPWFDANDGLPAFLLINDGGGSFSDATLAAGLGEKRRRRSYSASLVDLDADRDLDLVVVSDFAGLDTYLNDGSGKFTDVSETIVDERHSFGMSHTFDDFNADGQLDFYMTGMGSTTARRLQRLGIDPPGREESTKMRMPMGYGNRMYLRSDKRFVEPPFKHQVARTGWSWGSTSADFDNDGDTDLYVANGHISGKTTRDYCTRFWCHDIYTDVSKPKFELDQLFLKELGPTQRYEASWNGYEHNALLLNRDNQAFSNIGFLAGCGFEFDSRAVVSADLDADGRMDLLVSSQLGDGQSDRHELHVLRNTLEPGDAVAGNWIALRFAGKSAIGAQVLLHEPGGRSRAAQVVTGDSFCAQHPEVVHFGLGEQKIVTQIEVIWPDGRKKVLESPKTNAMIDLF